MRGDDGNGMGKAKEPASAAGKEMGGAGGIRPAYVVYGADNALRSRGLGKILERIAGDGNVTEYAGNAELADVLDELRTMPLLGDRRIVVIRDADAFITAHREPLEDFLAAPVPTGTLVLDTKRWASNTRLAKLVEKIGQAVKCEPPAGKDIPGWLTQYAAKLGKRMDQAAAQTMRELIGDDEPAIYLSEVEKLVTYVGERPGIGVADVQALISPMRIEKIWGVTDAIADRNAGQAIALWEEVLAGDKEAQFRAVGGLAFGIRKLLRARRLMDQGVPAEQAARQSQVFGPPQVVGARVRSFSSADLENRAGAPGEDRPVEQERREHPDGGAELHRGGVCKREGLAQDGRRAWLGHGPATARGCGTRRRGAQPWSAAMGPRPQDCGTQAPDSFLHETRRGNSWTT